VPRNGRQVFVLAVVDPGCAVIARSFPSPFPLNLRFPYSAPHHSAALLHRRPNVRRCRGCVGSSDPKGVGHKKIAVFRNHAAAPGKNCRASPAATIAASPGRLGPVMGQEFSSA